MRDGIKHYSNWPTIPQLYVKGEFVGGCDIVQMFQAGELQQLMADKGIEVQHAASFAALNICSLNQTAGIARGRCRPRLFLARSGYHRPDKQKAAPRGGFAV
ncbi:glutaredoxin domain-containing protein [Streptomyces canarius]